MSGDHFGPDDPYVPEPKGELGVSWDDIEDQAEELRRRCGNDPTLLPWMALVILGHIHQTLTDANPPRDF